jgi:peptide/nickel transport system substrate-binding protein
MSAKCSPARDQIRMNDPAVLEPGSFEGAELSSAHPTAFQEAPSLARLVTRGKLPPVAERIGSDPLVITPLRRIGRYGGTIRRASRGSADVQNPIRFAAGPDSPLFWDAAHTAVRPNIAKGFELRDGARVLILHLRRGMRWSDGAPFTADDFVFWYDDIVNCPALTPNSLGLAVSAFGHIAIRALDAYTVEYRSPAPNPLLVERLAGGGELSGLSIEPAHADGWSGYAPRHYLAQFHPRYVPEEELVTIARRSSIDGWAPLFRSRMNWLMNADLPVLTPWTVVKGSEIDKDPFVLERNPYSIWVDTAGNQLPYADRIVHVRRSAAEIAAGAAAGEYDYQDRHLQASELPVLMANRERGGYRVHVDRDEGGTLGLRLNLAYQQDLEIGALLRNVQFRRALSLGIDREAINRTFFAGMGTPSASLPADHNRYFPGAAWRTKWATLDILLANALLDDLGLSRRDAEGYRLRGDGSGRIRLVFEASAINFDYLGVGRAIKEDWTRIGIDLDIREVDATDTVRRIVANEVQLTASTVSSDDVFIFPDLVIPYVVRGSGLIGIPYARWRLSDGREGLKPFRELNELMEQWQRGYSAPREEDRIRVGKEILATHVDQVFSIGIISMGPSPFGLRLAKETLGNVPSRVVRSVSVRDLALPQTFYFEPHT